jgi:hypothetical protein
MSLRKQESVASDQSSTTNGSGISSSFPELRIDELKVPNIFDSKWIKSMKDTVKLRSDDIWIVTYPKCGTTWTQQIVRLIINGEKKDERTLFDAVPWVERFGSIPSLGKNYYIDIDTMASPRAFKSHFPYEMMPCGLPSSTLGRYIYVTRNPRDVAVSFFHHERGFSRYPMYEWDDFFERFLKGDVEFGDYFEHVLSWWAHKDDDNVLFLKYEDMKKDLPSAVATIAKFIGQDTSKELVEEIAHKTTFENMKNDSTANYEWMKELRRPNEGAFMRKGVVGDWKNYFTPEQIARLDAEYEKKLKQTGIDLEFQ